MKFFVFNSENDSKTAIQLFYFHRFHGSQSWPVKYTTNCGNGKAELTFPQEDVQEDFLRFLLTRKDLKYLTASVSQTDRRKR